MHATPPHTTIRILSIWFNLPSITELLFEYTFLYSLCILIEFHIDGSQIHSKNCGVKNLKLTLVGVPIEDHTLGC